MEIGGCNPQLGQSRTRYSYYFSRHSHTWGWATWQRAWMHYDKDIMHWPRIKRTQQWQNMWEERKEREYWETILDRVYKGEIDTWDYQWQLALWCNNALSAVPNLNLISNLGCGRGATHTRFRSHVLAELPLRNLDIISHPLEVKRNEEAYDFYFYKIVLGTQLRRLARSIRYVVQLVHQRIIGRGRSWVLNRKQYLT